jgi:hypothetical protein
MTLSVVPCRKMALSVLFFLPKHTRTIPSHSRKLIGGGGFRGSIRTTLESTLGGGRKLFFPTLSKCWTRDNSCVLTDSLE